MTFLPLQSRDLYLGTLFATEKQKVYGYVTNTRIKFILIVDSSNTTSLRDNEIRQMFRKLHTVYTQLLSNPFYVPGNQGSGRMSLILSGFVSQYYSCNIDSSCRVSRGIELMYILIHSGNMY